jgi:hypothetical protein
MRPGRAKVARENDFPVAACRVLARGIVTAPEGFSQLSCGHRVRKLLGGYNRGSMPRVGEFCPSNIARLLLGVVIVLTLVVAFGVWLFHSPGRDMPNEQPTHVAEPHSK